MESANNSTVDPQNGLFWDMENFLGPKAKWTIEPNLAIISKIVRRELALSEDAVCSLEFLGQGALNKVYAIQCGKGNYVLRVTLPVQPELKTMSEYATITYVRRHTDIPIPRVLRYEPNNNELGFEWMIMDRVPGKPFEPMWHEVSWLMKKVMVRKLISYLVQTFQMRSNAIGSLYTADDVHRCAILDESHATSDMPGNGDGPVQHRHHLSGIVSVPLFAGNHLKHDVPRGMFKNSHDWLAARIQFVINDTTNLPDGLDEDEIESLGDCKANAERLLKALPSVFSPDQSDEEFVLHHHDLSGMNFLVDDTDKTNLQVAGVIDWECITTVPLYYACKIPKLLRKRTNDECPDPDICMNETKEDGTVEINPLYWLNREEYEKTQLRQFFLEEMGRQLPEWVKIYDESKFKADFESAVDYCGYEPTRRYVSQWLDELEKGEPKSLAEAMDN
ncbi:phosphotransferase enzyme family-domain-containing protein [Massariosphaeria phaeospora]|uniref:Phosphotransferase enzyme family-domain-containing protein n=1 Tax=Massariosphaeria phaeospora TaxID=100035 RepID=A0A7C8I723_9PLEO|nr:phosphotransferase enzyme family-domain-containing protein [Massariosphaeria phaeospora]